MHQSILLSGLSLLALMTAQAALADTFIQAGNVIDGISNKALGPQTIVVADDTILRIVPGYAQPTDPGDDVIDLKDHTVMPGLMDMHTHLVATDGGPQSYVEPFTLSSADFVLKMERNAYVTLMSGFTVVRDLGDAHDVSISLRNAINRGMVVGPHIYTSTAPISSTGGHGDPTNGTSRDLGLTAVGPLQGVINSPYEAREAVRQKYKIGADVIKLTATGGVMSLASSGDNAQFMDDELEAIVATAKDYGLTVAAHAHGLEGIRRAVNAGVDSIEHGTYLDEETMQLMKKRGTYLVPTLMAGEWITIKSKDNSYLPEVVRKKAAKIGPRMAATFSHAYKVGVPIMFGTDSGVSAHGDNPHEFELMVEAGMPPMEAIKSATSVPARFLGIDDQYGSLAEGLKADIVAVPGNPLEDISAMLHVDFVMLGGKVVRNPD